MSGFQIPQDSALALRQRSCSRVSCKAELPKSSGVTGTCCDDNCLLEVARRECTVECHSNPISKTNEPCERHYKKTRDQYGAILANLGCICKVLLSLNIESCCVLPSHASVRSKRSAKSSIESVFGSAKNEKEIEGKNDCCGDGKKSVVEVKSCAEKNCCAETAAQEVAGLITEKSDCSEDACCGKSPNQVATEFNACSGKSSCCEDSPILTGATIGGDIIAKIDDCCKKACCDDAEPMVSTTSDCSKEDNFSRRQVQQVSAVVSPKLDDSCGSEEAIADVPSRMSSCAKVSCCSGSVVAVVPERISDTIIQSKMTCGGDIAARKSSEKYPTKTKNLATTCCSEVAGKETPPSTASCDKKICCSSVKVVDPPKTSCSNDKALDSTIVKVDDCSKKNCCSGSTGKSVPPMTNSWTKKSCIVKSIGPPNASCCSEKPLKPVMGVDEIDDCSKKSCCISELPISSSATETNVARALPTSSLKRAKDDLDIEKGILHVEHLILSVQGMTCTGCEKKLFRSLDSLPSTSNIKTSLVLAQAEFDVSSPNIIDTGSVIKTIEKMTGFSCTKMSQSGQELDLIADGNILDFSGKQVLPFGVTDVVILNKNTIRLTYDPRIVGARDLLSDPYLHPTKLAPHSARPQIASGRAHVRTTFYMTILSALLTIPVLVLAWAPLPKHEILYGAISLGLATTVQIVIAGPFYTAALKALIFSRMIEMDLLIVISTTAAYVYSVIAYAYLAAGKPLSTGQFFETSTLLVTLIMVGRAVSAFARQKAVESISMESLQTPVALLVDLETRREVVIDARLLQYGDTFKVLPDEKIVTDGVVLIGESEIDESMITGESELIVKGPGQAVIAGSLNHSGTLVVRLTRLPGENTITTIGNMVDEAKSSKPKIQQIADRVAGYFVPFILAITIIVFIIWVAIGKAVRHQDASTSCVIAMTYAISALIVSCPCAIGLAVPLVVVIAGGVAAKHGIIFKSAETIEIAKNVRHVVFDKTGTLTQGKLSIEKEEYLMGSVDELAPLILGLTLQSKHPVSIAIASHLDHLGYLPSKVENVVSVPGKGISATWDGTSVKAGNAYWLDFHDSLAVKELLSTGLTIFCISTNGQLAATFGLKDLLRPDTIQTITSLQSRSIEVSIISGDNSGAVNSIASLLDIPQSHVRSRFSPEDKQTYIKSLTSKSSKEIIMFIGDGTNDAIALAQADIGIHMNSGTEIAKSASDVVFMRPSLNGILSLIELSRAFNRRVLFNFGWAGVYNLFAILLAAGAFGGRVRIAPMYAGLGEIVSVLPVVGVAVMLRWVKI